MSYAKRHGHGVDADARRVLNSRAIWNKLYVNFILRRLNTSYSIKIADTRWYGHIECKEKWTTIHNDYNKHVTSVIELVVVADADRIAYMREREWLPVGSNVVARAYSDGTIWMHNGWYNMLFWGSRQRVRCGLAQTLREMGGGMYQVKNFSNPIQTAQMAEDQTFTAFMNENWRV